MKFNDEQIINRALVSLKHLRMMYAYFAEEAGTPECFQTANELFEEVTQMQRNTYDLMIEQGWMTVQAQTASAIEKSHKQLKTKISEMK